MEIGQIFFADKSIYKEAKHLIVYLGESNYRAGFYKGVMLTHAKGYGNIEMRKEHFSDDFNFKDTHVVNIGLLKPDDWKLHKEQGTLTEEGLNFILTNVPKSKEPENTWDELVPSYI